MSETVDYVKSLSDDELYNELRERGFPAGPVVGKCIYSIANDMQTTHNQAVAM